MKLKVTLSKDKFKTVVNCDFANLNKIFLKKDAEILIHLCSYVPSNASCITQRYGVEYKVEAA